MRRGIMQNMTKSDREKLLNKLDIRAKKGLEKRGAPFHGATEKDVLIAKVELERLKGEVKNLRENLNILFKERAELVRESDHEKAVLETLANLLCQEIQMSSKEFDQSVLLSKLNILSRVHNGGKPKIDAESAFYMRYRIKDYDGNILEDKMDQVLYYAMGSGAISDESVFIDLKKDETHEVDVVFTKHHKKEILGVGCILEFIPEIIIRKE